MNADTTPEAAYENPRCPDHTAHYENAFDRLFPSGHPTGSLTPAQAETIDALADAEYRACEGHR